MKIYTKTGDKGDTGLIGGARTSKSDPRIMAYGAVDELNSNIGLAIATLSSKKVLDDLMPLLTHIQNDLFVVGSDLADPNLPVRDGEQKSNTGSTQGTPRVAPEQTAALEKAIDRFESELDPIRFFILPGGSVEASILHVCRSVCRRAEAAVVLLGRSQQAVNPEVTIYLNRLSDLLFVSARLANKRLGVADIAWTK